MYIKNKNKCSRTAQTFAKVDKDDFRNLRVFQRIFRLASRCGRLTEFNGNFLVQIYVCRKILVKIRSVVVT